MKLFLVFTSLFISILSISKPALADQEVVVLVPGFFNSFAPEYFSPQVIRAFQAQGFKVYVAEGMNPVGTIEDNGERLLKNLARIEAVERRHVAFNVVGHRLVMVKQELGAMREADRQEIRVGPLAAATTRMHNKILDLKVSVQPEIPIGDLFRR